MNVEEHILLSGRKALAARLVQIEAALPLEARFRRESAEIAYARLDLKLKDIFPQEKEQLDNNEIRLDVSLDTLIGRLQFFAQGDLLKQPQLFDDLQQALDQRAKRMACDACSKLAPLVCNGGVRDDEIVSLGGACLAPLKDMFDIAHNVGRHYYVTRGTLMTGNPDVVFATEKFSQKNPHHKPHDLPVDYFINGETVYADTPGLTRARVVLKVPVEAFDTNTYLSTLYILFHECIVHAFHAITSTAQTRVGPKPEDRFVEGWMDWVSYEVLNEVLSGTGLVKAPVNLRFLRQRRDRAFDFHLARVKCQGPSMAPFSQLASQRATGKSAATKVLDLFKNRPKDCTDPWKKFLQLSFDLNMMSDFDEDQRETFVTMLDFLEDDDRAPDLSPQHNILAGIVTNYLRNNNIRRFIDSVLALKTRWLR
ncbi:MAG: hypothetical protein AABM67_18680 [Acidobacteriota bacterium]